MIEDPAHAPTTAARAPEPGEVRAWIVLVVLIAAIIALNQLAPKPELTVEPAGSADLRFQARYVLGVQTLFGPFLAMGGNSEEQLLQQLDIVVKTAAEAVCLVPVAAEVGGAEAALERVAAARRRGDLAPEDESDLALLERIYADTGEDGSVPEITGEQRDAFRERRAYYADLALTYGRDDDDPERRRLLDEARRIAVAVLALGMAVGVFGLVGLVLFVTAVVLFRNGKLASAYDRGAAKLHDLRHPYVQTLVVFLLANVALGLLSILVTKVAGPALGLATHLLGLPVVFWPLVRGISQDELRQACGWHGGTSVLREMAAGFGAYLAGSPILLAAMMVSLVLAKLLDAQPSHPLVESIASAGAAQIIIIFVLATVWAPLVEESIFRGGFYHYLRGRLGILGAAFASSFVFAIIHPQGLLGVPPLVALAMILALIREWRGSLVGSITVHAVHNAATMTFVFLMLG